MSSPIRPEIADKLKSIPAKLHDNLTWLRQNGGTDDQMRAEIARAKQAMDEQSFQERRAAVGDDSRGALQSALQGATFGFGDEITAAGRALTGEPFKDALSDERQSIADYERAHPVASTTLNVAGGVLSPISLLGKAKQGAGFLARAGRAVGEGALQGGIAGVGASNLGDMPDRNLAAQAAVGGLKGMLLGGATAGALNTAGAAGGAIARPIRAALSTSGGKQLAQQEAERLAGQAGGDDLSALYDKLASFGKSGRGNDVMLMDVLGKPGWRAARGARSASPAADQLLDTRLGGRSAKVGDRAIGDIEAASGIKPEETRQTIDQMIETQRARATPLYDAAAQEASTFDAVPGKVQDMLRAADRPVMALPAPGQTADALSKKGLPPVATEGDFNNFHEAVQHFKGRDLPSVQYDVEPFAGGSTGRPIKMMGANDTRVRRDPVVPEPLPETTDRFTAWNEKAQRLAADPDIAPYIAGAKRADRSLRGKPDTDHAVLDAAYKLMNDEYGTLGRAIKTGQAVPTTTNMPNAQKKTLDTVRGMMRDLISERAPTYPKGLESFSTDMGILQAYEGGRNAIQTDLGDLQKFAATATEGERAAWAKGFVSDLVDQIRNRTPDPNLGPLARGVDIVGNLLGKRNVTDRVRTVFGEDAYKALLPRLKAEAEFQLADAATRKGSNTVEKMVDLAGQADPEKLMEAAIQTGAGRPLGAAVAGARALGHGLRETMAGRGGHAATSMAELMATQGEGPVKALLDQIAQRRAQAAIPSGTITSPRRPLKQTGVLDALSRLSGMAQP